VGKAWWLLIAILLTFGVTRIGVMVLAARRRWAATLSLLGQSLGTPSFPAGVIAGAPIGEPGQRLRSW